MLYSYRANYTFLKEYVCLTLGCFTPTPHLNFSGTIHLLPPAARVHRSSSTSGRPLRTVHLLPSAARGTVYLLRWHRSQEIIFFYERTRTNRGCVGTDHKQQIAAEQARPCRGGGVGGPAWGRRRQQRRSSLRAAAEVRLRGGGGGGRGGSGGPA